MHIGQIIKSDCANGIGIRLSLFVSGCTNHCKGCFQPETWNFEYGEPYTEQTEEFLLKELSKPHYTGLSLLGGEPFEIENQRALVGLIRRMKTALPTRDLWIYTGFTYEKDLVLGGKRYCEVTDEILDATDILVDGKFVEELRNLMLKYRGSENQRILDMKRTREEGHIVLSPLNQ